jgi:hypothetical protein
VKEGKEPNNTVRQNAMASTPNDDWRLTNQGKYLKGVTLSLRKFHIRKERPDWDHEHCEFCWAKIVEIRDEHDANLLTQAYATSDGAHWICPRCFDDFRRQFGWLIDNEKTA